MKPFDGALTLFRSTSSSQPEERDPDLSAKLEAEWPGIFAWMVCGFTEWQVQKGLNPPAIVTAATVSYFDAEDAVTPWMTECGVRETEAFEPDSRLFASYSAWMIKSGEQPGTTQTSN